MQTYPRSIKTALNRRAHAEGLAYEEAVKSRLLAELERLKANGATPAELVAYLEGEHPATEGSGPPFPADALRPFPVGELRPWGLTR
ncbi:hypothetical protein ebA808 [Aromatoleum aromaticum EbN1]|uniref:Uncharacterized protein n=1 Tax=Aromatoleum aromaticum (strain DSM 19018 / LMG 30748 / EbN1) TaxID=76114 RepID=Q5P816_AROAE|nr:hypothetical protein [Aromatoleum aromaticum]CAI06545.1 hypothetical protein ebA808 [Aromatoleum aromaticum EbN1]